MSPIVILSHVTELYLHVKSNYLLNKLHKILNWNLFALLW